MKKLFDAIRASDFHAVKEIIEKNPDLVNAIAKKPPKMDDGNSPLQVAYKRKSFEIANFLIDNGADVDWIDTSAINDFHSPVLHCAITSSIMSTRYPSYSGYENSKEIHEQSIFSLRKLLEKCHNVNSIDSYDNTSAMIAVSDLNQFNWNADCSLLIEDLTKTIILLKKYGVDFTISTSNHPAPKTLVRDIRIKNIID